MVKTYAALYMQARNAIRELEGDFAPNVARELVSAAAGISSEKLLSMLERTADEAVCERVETFVSRCLKHEPLPYILGQWDFYDMTLTVTPDVLIPRDDTTVVTEMAVQKALFLGERPRILDLCTGSGCIGIAIAKRVADARVTLGDISEAALKVAKHNVQAQGLSARISCIRMDARKPAMPFLGTFDLIVSNPPYITSAEMLTLDPSVQKYEPHLALDGGEDGLDFYRAILENFTAALAPGGYLCFEFGQGQEEAVCELLQAYHYEILELRRDTADIIRAVLAQKEMVTEDGIEENDL